jgi:hypothetical protein
MAKGGGGFFPHIAYGSKPAIERRSLYMMCIFCKRSRPSRSVPNWVISLGIGAQHLRSGNFQTASETSRLLLLFKASGLFPPGWFFRIKKRRRAGRDPPASLLRAEEAENRKGSQATFSLSYAKQLLLLNEVRPLLRMVRFRSQPRGEPGRGVAYATHFMQRWRLAPWWTGFLS